MPVSGPNITVGTTIASIDDATTIQLSANAAGTGFKVASSFGSATVIRVADTAGFQQLLNEGKTIPVSGTGVGAGAIVTSVIGPKHITVSVASTQAATNTLNFGVSNDYTGTTVVNGGIVNLSGAPGVRVIPGDLVINGNPGGATTTVTMVTNAGQIVSSSNVTINGSGTLTLVGNNTLNSLSFNNYGGGAAPTVTVAASTTLTLAASNAITATNDNLGFTPIITGGNLAFTNVAPIINVSGLSPVGLIIGSIITSSTGAITKIGTGSLVLTGANTFASGFNLNQGTVIFSNGAAFGTLASTLNIADGTTLIAGATVTVPNAITVGANASFTIGGAGLTAVNNPTFSGIVTLGSGSHTITVESPLVRTTITGRITGTTGFTLAGSGTLVLQSTTNTNDYGGSTTISSGMLSLGTIAEQIPNNSALTIGSTGILNLAGLSETVGSLSGEGIVTNAINATTSVLTVGQNNASTTFSGVITQGSPLGTGIVSLVKTGTGTLTLSGLNTYTGPTTIQNGAISISVLENSTQFVPKAGGLGAALGTTALVLGSGATTGTLIYTGATTTTDRVINLGGTTGGGVIDAAGVGAITFTANLQATGVGAKSLTLTGINTGLNTFAGDVRNGSGTTSLVKNGTGTWVLGGVFNSYTGTTTVNAGSLVLNRAGTSASAPGLGNTAITVNSGARLAVVGSYFAGNAAVQPGSATLNLTSGSVFDMTGDGTFGTFTLQQDGNFPGIGNALTIGGGGTPATLLFEIKGGTTSRDRQDLHHQFPRQ